MSHKYLHHNILPFISDCKATDMFNIRCRYDAKLSWIFSTNQSPLSANNHISIEGQIICRWFPFNLASAQSWAAVLKAAVVTGKNVINRSSSSKLFKLLTLLDKLASKIRLRLTS